MFDKDTIFAEFNHAKQKDLKMSKKKSPYETVFTNRIELLKSHIEAKKSHPKYYRGCSINFENLLLAYQSPVPVDHFYKVGFSMTYAEYLSHKNAEDDDKKDKTYSNERTNVKEVTFN